ncbi:unnamed protein product [Meloidogyne enterolobii]|uniref:Uncharacterized protein n=1 Tax=Meloidogyne enterolobii TaxID=390850 RepID=A0ACB0XNK4_MELEN
MRGSVSYRVIEGLSFVDESPELANPGGNSPKRIFPPRQVECPSRVCHPIIAEKITLRAKQLDTIVPMDRRCPLKCLILNVVLDWD